MKRLSFALLSVLLLFGLTSLVACGGGGNEAGHTEEPAPAGPTEDDAVPAEEAPTEPVSSAPAESDMGEGDAAHGDGEVPSAAGDGAEGDAGDAGDDNQG